MLTTIAVQNHRSLHELRVPLAPLTVVTGANGSGKSNLYRALRLLADCADRRVVASLAREGGLPSALWAGPEQISGAVRRGEQVLQGTGRSRPVSLQLGFASEALSYLIDLGIQQSAGGPSAFDLDPEIKRELVWFGPVLRPATLIARRQGPSVQIRGEAGWEQLASGLRSYESMLEITDPRRAPELFDVREQIRDWRFYDHFRTDVAAPARQAQVGTRTTVLDADGRDLAAAVQTIIEIGDGALLARLVDDAFPGSTLSVEVSRGRFDLQLLGPGLLRPLTTAELSDGTLRYLLLIAALLSPRPPGLMVVNEPETSLHPDLLAPLARLMVTAADRSQLMIITHASPLADALREVPGAAKIQLDKSFGETAVDGLGRIGGPPWSWGTR